MKTYFSIISALFVLLVGVPQLYAQNTAFTYQGRLTDGGTPANGTYDLKFAIYDASTGSNAVTEVLPAATTPVSNGLFTAMLDFSPGMFTGSNRWLEIAVRVSGGSSSAPFTTLEPRHMISPAPQALYAETARSALTVPAGNITGTLLPIQLPPDLVTNGASGVTLSGSFAGDGAGLTNLNLEAVAGATNSWLLGGNTTTPGQNLGSLNNQPVEIVANGQRVLRLESTLNIIGGSAANSMNLGAVSSVIGGGEMHLISSDLSVIGGGWANLIKSNSANSVIGGGEYNQIRENAGFSVISGGGGNIVAAAGQYATIPGGAANSAAGKYSLAAGNRAKALHVGSFVWGDATQADVSSTSSNQFIIRATGGVGINKTNPATALDVNGTVSALNFSGAGTGLSNINASSVNGLSTNFWQTKGNAGIVEGSHFLGTTDNAPLEFRVGNARALRLDTTSYDNLGYVISGLNVLGGYSGNIIDAGLVGATIAGGGQHASALGTPYEYPNVVTGHYGTVSGGYGNTAGTIGTVAGGCANAAGSYGTVAGGYSNTASNAGTVPGGHNNHAIGTGSFAAGVGANALHTNSFLWSDGNTVSSSTNKAFEIYASGCVNFRTGGKFDVRSLSANSATLHVGSDVAGIEPKLLQFGDGDYVHVGENGLDDRMELKAGTFFFTHDASEKGRVGIGTNLPLAMLHVADAGSLAEPQLQLTETATGGNYARLRMSQANNPYWDIAVGGGAANVMNFYNSSNNNVMVLSQAGDLTVRTITILGGADLAEPFEMSADEIPSGSVVVIDENHPGHLKLSENAYDTRVAGVVSGAQGISPGVRMKQKDILENGQNVALSGRVYVQAEALHGAIRPGDLLTTSTLPGRAMKVTDHARGQGAILGKAMTALASGEGTVLVLVTLQ